MTSKRFYRIAAPLAVLLTAIVLMAWGGFATTYKVYEEVPEDANDPFILFEKVHDPAMVEECTISGVARSPAGLFYYTYDRSAPPKLCPT